MVNVAGVMSSVYTFVWILLILTIVGGIIALIIYILKYKHRVRIREIANNRIIIYDDKARDYKDKDGITYWKLLKKRDTLPLPQSEAIELTSKGKKCIEVYRTPTGEYVFIKDQVDLNEVKPFQPLTTNQRQILVNQYKKAYARRQKAWAEYVIPVASLGAIVLLVIMLMVFWGDLAQPLLDMGSKQMDIADKQTESVRMMQEIIQKKQIIEPEAPS